MVRLLDCLDNSLGCADTFDGRNLRLDRFARNADFQPRRIWNLDIPDVSGLSAKAFSAADRWQVRRGACRRKAVMSDLISQMNFETL